MLQHEYARSALLLGLSLGRALGANPFRFGMIGSTDAHGSLSGSDEADFVGIAPTVEPGPGRMAYPLYVTPVATIRGFAVSASGTAGVWASANTREALFDALRRREVYASTGPRITLRFYGGWEFSAADAARPDPAAVGDAKGVPMGGLLPSRPEGRAPGFLVSALRDPDGANLDRAQIVKGWHDAAGAPLERVFDVAWSGSREPGSNGKLPTVGSSNPSGLYGPVALTTVRQPLIKMAEDGIKELNRLINLREKAPAKKTLLPAELVIRDSCKSV